MGNSLSLLEMSYYAFQSDTANSYHTDTCMTREIISPKGENLSSTFQKNYYCTYKIVRSDSSHFADGEVSSFLQKKALIFCHGNACTVTEDMIRLFERMRLDVDCFLFEYPGYGEDSSFGYPTKKIVRDSLKYLHRKIRGEYVETVFLGHSLGTAVVLDYLSHIKSYETKCILLSPFTSIQTLIIGSTSPMDDYVNIENIKNLKDVTIFHGKQDKVIPYEHSLKLAGDKHPVSIINATHNDILMKNEVVSELKRL